MHTRFSNACTHDFFGIMKMTIALFKKSRFYHSRGYTYRKTILGHVSKVEIVFHLRHRRHHRLHVLLRCRPCHMILYILLPLPHHHYLNCQVRSRNPTFNYHTQNANSQSVLAFYTYFSHHPILLSIVIPPIKKNESGKNNSISK